MKTKLLLVVPSIMLFPVAIFAQSAEPTEFTVDLGTFTGLVAVVTFFATQIAKLIPYIKENRWAKIVSAIVIGVLICLGCWATGLTPFLIGLEVWQVLLYGVGAGLSACGFYDIVKPFLSMFGKKKE